MHYSKVDRIFRDPNEYKKKQLKSDTQENIPKAQHTLHHHHHHPHSSQNRESIKHTLDSSFFFTQTPFDAVKKSFNNTNV